MQKDKNSGKIKVFTLNQSWEDIISDLLANGIYIHDLTSGREIQQTKNECNKLDTIAFDLNDTSQRVMSKLGMIELKKVTKIHIHGEIYLEDNPFFVIGRELTEEEKLIQRKWKDENNWKYIRTTNDDRIVELFKSKTIH